MQASNCLRRAEIANTNLLLSSLLRRGGGDKIKETAFCAGGVGSFLVTFWGDSGASSSVLLHHNSPIWPSG